nr:immunoglobulin heavy chain junction region [Macaca mulatta]MOX61280.1 immunoglobulin heavy chain junction region [Macaca mulatta]MOX61876.1 immunoglobulin heavy chain junction region [Macaca mulatta]MOX62513.1 immunoglobulin heavy chain junction region [Macaca mulatta]MOX64008.1 immunoglobulin heavy chain junction region [Macaca mulatta]
CSRGSNYEDASDYFSAFDSW